MMQGVGVHTPEPSSTQPDLNIISKVTGSTSMFTAVWTPTLVCLSELPKWSGRPWSMHLPTARSYSLNTGWRQCWSASDSWWVFLIVSHTLVSSHLMNVQNAPSRNDETGWIGGGHSEQPRHQQSSMLLFALSPELWHLCSDVKEELDSFFQPGGKLCRLSSCWSRCLMLSIGSGAPEKYQHFTELYHCKCRNGCTLLLSSRRLHGEEGFPKKTSSDQNYWLLSSGHLNIHFLFNQGNKVLKPWGISFVTQKSLVKEI